MSLAETPKPVPCSCPPYGRSPLCRVPSHVSQYDELSAAEVTGGDLAELVHDSEAAQIVAGVPFPDLGFASDDEGVQQAVGDYGLAVALVARLKERKKLQFLIYEMIIDNNLTCEPHSGYYCQCSTARALRLLPGNWRDMEDES